MSSSSIFLYHDHQIGERRACRVTLHVYPQEQHVWKTLVSSENCLDLTTEVPLAYSEKFGVQIAQKTGLPLTGEPIAKRQKTYSKARTRPQIYEWSLGDSGQ